MRVHAIADFDWPVSLLDLALGMLVRTGSAAPIYFSGYEPGYESVPSPGLYDPATADGVSPLLSAFEALRVTPNAVAAVDAFSFEIASSLARAELLDALEEVCEATEDPGRCARRLTRCPGRCWKARWRACHANGCAG